MMYVLDKVVVVLLLLGSENYLPGFDHLITLQGFGPYCIRVAESGGPHRGALAGYSRRIVIALTEG